jgi:tetratricopeptide (TPR) repeat protein
MKRRTWTWKEARLPGDLTEKLQSRFEMSLFEAAAPVDPENTELLTALGDLYAKQGLLEKGLEVDQKLVQIEPREPTYHYNLACSHSLLGHIDPAFQALVRALQLGYDKLDHLKDDPDLANLKKDRRYESLVKDLGKKMHG